jgi:hypothetical protein
MLKKSSVFMIVLLVAVAASLIRTSLYQYVEGQGSPAPQQQKQSQQQIKDIVGTVGAVDIYASSDGKACIAEIKLSSTRPNSLGLALSSTIDLLAPDESICDLFSVSSMNNRGVFLEVQKLTTLNALPPTLRASGDYQVARLYLVHRAGI